MSKHAMGGCMAALLMLGLLTACRHKAPPPPVPPATAPPLTASNITVITPLPSVPAQAKADVQPAPKEQPAPPPQARPVQRVRRLRHKRSAPPAASAETKPAGPPAEAQPATAPASGTPVNGTPGVTPNPPAPGTEASSPTVAQAAAPALGQLSAGTAINTAERTRMLGEIQQQEARLSRLKPARSSEALTLEMQVKSFLNKARQAIAEDDLDGAQTLNTKARVLLDELQSE